MDSIFVSDIVDELSTVILEKSYRVDCLKLIL